MKTLIILTILCTIAQAGIIIIKYWRQFWDRWLPVIAVIVILLLFLLTVPCYAGINFQTSSPTTIGMNKLDRIIRDLKPFIDNHEPADDKLHNYWRERIEDISWGVEVNVFEDVITHGVAVINALDKEHYIQAEEAFELMEREYGKIKTVGNVVVSSSKPSKEE